MAWPFRVANAFSDTGKWINSGRDPEKIDMIRFVLFDDGTLRAYDHVIFEREPEPAQYKKGDCYEEVPHYRDADYGVSGSDGTVRVSAGECL